LNTYWVYENISKQVSFYSKLDILLLLSSTALWKKNHPHFTTNVFFDQMTYDLIDKLNALKLWDNIEILPENKFIDKNVFWASSKLEVLRYIKGPSIIMDHDFLVYDNLDTHLNDNIVVAVEEDGRRYYPTGYDPFMRAIRKELPRPKTTAINCSFLYFPTDSFANMYARKSLELMDKFTKLKAPNSRYLIVSEQLLLKHLLDTFNIRYDSLMKAQWNCIDKKYVEYSKGIFPLEECSMKFRHYWMDKNKIRESKEDFDYTQEIRILQNILSKYSLNLEYLNGFKP